QFQQLAKAYEVLSSPQLREAYDYYLAHPNEQLYNRYRFYQARYQPKLPLLHLIVGLLLFITAIQYINAWTLYHRHCRIASSSPQFLAKLATERQRQQQSVSEHELRRRLLSSVVVDGRVIDTPSLFNTLLFWPLRSLWLLWSSRHERRRLRLMEEKAEAAAEERAKAEEEQARHRAEERLRLRQVGRERKMREQQLRQEAIEQRTKEKAEAERARLQQKAAV
ncbi:hypothetical protein FOZ63_014721, partial [Perkinsus olseni]